MNATTIGDSLIAQAKRAKLASLFSAGMDKFDMLP